MISSIYRALKCHLHSVCLIWFQRFFIRYFPHISSNSSSHSHTVIETVTSMNLSVWMCVPFCACAHTNCDLNIEMEYRLLFEMFSMSQMKNKWQEIHTLVETTFRHSARVCVQPIVSFSRNDVCFRNSIESNPRARGREGECAVERLSVAAVNKRFDCGTV